MEEMRKKVRIKKFVSLPFEIKQLEEEEGVFTFEGFASTFGNEDLDSDIIDRGAFRNSLAKRTPKLLWQHSMDEPLGVFTLIEERETGLFVKAKMPLEDTFVSGRVKPQINIGSITSMSIGFFIVEATFNRDENIRMIHEVELFEISLVSIPANPQAVITSFKRADMDNFFKMNAKEQEELFTSGVKFSQRTAKELVTTLKHKKNEREAQGTSDRDDRQNEKMNQFLKDLEGDREDHEEKKLGSFLKSLEEKEQ